MYVYARAPRGGYKLSEFVAFCCGHRDANLVRLTFFFFFNSLYLDGIMVMRLYVIEGLSGLFKQCVMKKGY